MSSIRSVASMYVHTPVRTAQIWGKIFLSLNRITDTPFAFIGVFVLVFFSSFIILSMDCEEYYSRETDERLSPADCISKRTLILMAL